MRLIVNISKSVKNKGGRLSLVIGVYKVMSVLGCTKVYIFLSAKYFLLGYVRMLSKDVM